jgi:hypothetical protein
MEVQSNYMYSRYNPVTDQRLSRQYILPDSTYFYNQASRNDTRSHSHRFNLTYDYVIDSFHSLKFTPSLTLQNSNGRVYSSYETLSEKLLNSNMGFSKNISNSDGYTFNGTALFRKKFRKRGRTLSISMGSNLRESDGENNLESVNKYFNTLGVPVKTDSTNQNRFNELNTSGYNARAVYTEPVLKRSLLELSLSRNYSRSVSNQQTFDYNKSTGAHDIINPLLSNQYENTYGTTLAGFRLRTQKKKYNYSLGVSWQNASLEGTIKTGRKDSVISKSFYNLLPNARFQYNFTRFKNLQVDYRATTTQPVVSQLQPVPDNSNPINIRLGNPGLKQEFSHRVSANYTGMNPFRSRSFFLFSSYTFTNNKIVNYDVIDSFGRKITAPVNVNGVYSLNNDFSFGWPLKPLKANLNFNTAVLFSKNIQYINTVRNAIHNFMMAPNLEISRTFHDKFDVMINAGLTYTHASYSLQSILNNVYITQEYGITADWQLPKNFSLSSDFRYTINSRRAEGYNVHVPLWNASVSKLFLKYNRGEIKLSVHDLLNENQSIVRTTNQNYIEDQSNRVLRRFFLLSFTYSLNKMAANSGEGGRGNIIIRR